MRVLVHGLAITGASTVRALHRRGHDVVVTDDSITQETTESADGLGVVVQDPPSDEQRPEFIAGFDLFSPAPGVPENHPLVVAAPVTASPWTRTRISRPRG